MAGLDSKDGEVRNVGSDKAKQTQRPLHRLGAVRRLQGISRRTVARRLAKDVLDIKAQERGTSDILLSDLYHWQQILEVPITELLVEGNEELAAPILRRAQLVRFMKTAMSIQEMTSEETVRRMVQTLIEQLGEIMPELKQVVPWHTVGMRRRREELGKAAVRRLSAEVFVDLLD